MPSGMYARVGLCPMTAREWGLAAGSAAPCRCQRNECVNKSPVPVISRWLGQRLDVVAGVTAATGGRGLALRAGGTGTGHPMRTNYPQGKEHSDAGGTCFP